MQYINARQLVSQLKQKDEFADFGSNLGLTVGFMMAFVSSYFMLFYVKERITNAKHLQYVSGVDVCTFWCVAFILDLLIFFILSLCLVLTLAAFQVNGFKTLKENGRYFKWGEYIMIIILN